MHLHGQDGHAHTEAALRNYVKELGFNCTLGRIAEEPFTSERRMMSVFCSDGCTYVKGAPDVLIKLCTHISQDGVVRAMTEGDVGVIEGRNAALSDAAMRVLAFAYRRGKGESGLTFLGLAGLADGLKPGVKQAVEECRRAGITTVMITGDHARTALAVAKQAGICYDASLVYSGEQLDAMSARDRAAAIRRGRVFARVTPAHKNAIVKVKRRAGEVVAMTGDGVNDAPSIKSADIGVAMGVSGTDVTKSVADMVIADDSFTTIVAAVREGRRISSNISKTVNFYLSTNLAEVLAILIATFAFAGCDFLLSTQLLWINLITDSFPVLALGVERDDADSMLRPPVRPQKAMLGRSSLALGQRDSHHHGVHDNILFRTLPRLQRAQQPLGAGQGRTFKQGARRHRCAWRGGKRGALDNSFGVGVRHSRAQRSAVACRVRAVPVGGAVRRVV